MPTACMGPLSWASAPGSRRPSEGPPRGISGGSTMGLDPNPRPGSLLARIPTG
jgi:hypothetical protein